MANPHTTLIFEGPTKPWQLPLLALEVCFRLQRNVSFWPRAVPAPRPHAPPAVPKRDGSYHADSRNMLLLLWDSSGEADLTHEGRRQTHGHVGSNRKGVIVDKGRGRARVLAPVSKPRGVLQFPPLLISGIPGIGHPIMVPPGCDPTFQAHATLHRLFFFSKSVLLFLLDGNETHRKLTSQACPSLRKRIRVQPGIRFAITALSAAAEVQPTD